MSENEKKEEKKEKKQSARKAINWDGITEKVKSFDDKIKKYDYFQFLTFEKTYALIAIKAAYWIGLFVLLAYSLIWLLTASSIGNFLMTLLYIPLALLALRISCELLMVWFGIYERLGEIKKELSKKDK